MARLLFIFCGSPLYVRLDTKRERFRVRVGRLDMPLSEKPEAHIFATSKAHWYEIADDLPRYPEREPGRWYGGASMTSLARCS